MIWKAKKMTDNKDTANAAGTMMAILGGAAMYALTADPSKVGNLLSDERNPEKEDETPEEKQERMRKEAKERQEKLKESADRIKEFYEAGKNGDKQGFLKAFVTLPVYMRHGISKVARDIRDAKPVEAYDRLAERTSRVIKSTKYSAKRGFVKGVNSELDNQKVELKNDVDIETEKGKKFVLKKGTKVAFAKANDVFYLKTFFPPRLNRITENSFQGLKDAA